MDGGIFTLDNGFNLIIFSKLNLLREKRIMSAEKFHFLSFKPLKLPQ
jgi:hypothetical protein